MISLIESYEGIELALVLVAYLVAILFALTIHEYAHARVAYNKGDETPKAQGRLTLNPFAHIDTMGFLCLILVGFGWAKPVQVNPIKFKEYRKDYFKVSVAGILTNLITAFFTCGLYCLLYFIMTNNLQAFSTNTFLKYFYFFTSNLLSFFTIINLCLFLFNLIPVYPLDGFNILQTFTKSGNKVENFLRRYGSLILFAYIIIDAVLQINLFTTCIEFILRPLESFWFNLIF